MLGRGLHTQHVWARVAPVMLPQSRSGASTQTRQSCQCRGQCFCRADAHPRCGRPEASSHARTKGGRAWVCGAMVGQKAGVYVFWGRSASCIVKGGTVVAPQATVDRAGGLEYAAAAGRAA
eukprot:283032-Chlamydomonas_euryale.AAC.1